MKTNLKDDIWIEGFDTPVYPITALNRKDIFDVLYAGEVSEISEEYAEKYAAKILEGKAGEDLIFKGRWYDYIDYLVFQNSAIESIKTACPQKYCLIYRK